MQQPDSGKGGPLLTLGDWFSLLIHFLKADICALRASENTECQMKLHFLVISLQAIWRSPQRVANASDTSNQLPSLPIP